MIYQHFVVLLMLWHPTSCLAPFNNYGVSSSSSNSSNGGASNVILLASRVMTPINPDTSTITILDCRSKPDNYAVADYATKCRRYYRCTSSLIISASVYLCPGKLVFNGSRCVPSTEYLCLNSTSTVVEQETIAGDCEGQLDGYYQDTQSGCRSYFYCTNGMKAIYVCGGQTVFDGQRCVDPESYQCPFRSTDCYHRSNEPGYYTDVNSGCRNYYFCSADGHKLITLTCSDGRLFNGVKCVDPGQYRCPQEDHYYAYWKVAGGEEPQKPQKYFISSSSSSSSSQSAGDCKKSNGFFVSIGTGCRNYYYCINGVRTDLNCSGKNVFNGDVCVDSSQYNCPENDDDDALLALPESNNQFNSGICYPGRANGLYLDDSSSSSGGGGGCRGYVYCKAGRQQGATVYCSASERFSSRDSRCRPKHEVDCPSHSANSEVTFPNASSSSSY